MAVQNQKNFIERRVEITILGQKLNFKKSPQIAQK